MDIDALKRWLGRTETQRDTLSLTPLTALAATLDGDACQANPGEPPPAAPAARTDEQVSRRVVPDPVLLFRYSALTFNGHRIHYDRPYAMEVEHYPGLVVHGPLIATLLLDQLRRHAGQRLHLPTLTPEQ